MPPREENVIPDDDSSSSDPSAPVEGISLEQFANAAVAMFGQSGEEVEATAQAHGIPAGRVQAISEEWNRRFMAHPELVQEYNALYQQAMREQGVEAPDISLEQYADILIRSRETPLEQVLPDFGLNMQTFALISGTWGERLMADPSLAARFGQILAPPTN